MIEPITNRNFCTKFQHQNGTNQSQHTNKNTIQQHQHTNNSQRYRHIKTSKQYQPRSFQIPSTSSITYLKEDCIGCGNDNKGMKELLTKHDGRLDNFPLQSTIVNK